MNLVLDMQRLGNPFFSTVKEQTVRERAAALPQDGVPPEVLKVINQLDDALDKLQPQKAAAPRDGLESIDAGAGVAFAIERPRAAVAEGHANQDAHQGAIAALNGVFEEAAQQEGPAAAQVMEIRTGFFQGSPTKNRRSLFSFWSRVSNPKKTI